MGTTPVDSLKEGWKCGHQFGRIFGRPLLPRLLFIACLVCYAAVLNEGFVVFLIAFGLFMQKHLQFPFESVTESDTLYVNIRKNVFK